MRASALELADLGYRYPDAPDPTLWEVSVSLAPYRVVAVAGPSGAGKSTLARLVAGLLPGLRGGERSGVVRLGGAALPPSPSAAVGMLMQDPEAQMAGVRVREELSTAARRSRLGADRVEAIYAALGVQRLSARRIQGLSGGELQRVALAVTLARGGRCVVLDEPTSNLDDDGARALRDTLARLLDAWDGTLLVVEHRPRGPVELAEATLWLTPNGGVRLSPHNPCRQLAEALDRGYRSGGGRGAPPVDDGRGTPLLELVDVAGGYRRAAALRDVRLRLRVGEIVGIAGRNGAGKSTLLALIAGTLRRSAGQLRWRGRRMRRGPPLRELGYLMQNPLHQLFCDTVRAEVTLSPRNHRLQDATAAADDAMAAADLEGLAGRATLALSYGQQQRVALAAALAHRPSLALLDEPTHGMDAAHMAGLVQLVRRRRDQGTAFAITSHDRAFLAALCDRVVELDGGTSHG